MKRKPNIVYILADDMGYGDVSCLNENAAFKTPNFDALAKAGMAFTDAHASSAVCSPSRYSLLTGRYNWRSTLKEGVLLGYSEPLIEKGRKTVASMLSGEGYSTYCVGKWHLGFDWGEKDIWQSVYSKADIDFDARIDGTPNDYGFDYFFGIAGSLDMAPYVYIENHGLTAKPDHTDPGRSGKQFYRPGPCGADFVHEEVLPTFTRKVTDIIAQSDKDAPFFIYFPLNAPHTPILPSEEFRGKSGTNEYGDYVLMCDDVVGKVVKALEDKGVLEDTIVVFTSDNGCSPSADFAELARFGHEPSYIYRGAKADIYEGGHRVPLLIRWGNGIGPAQKCAQSVCLCDLYATLCEMLGVERAPCEAEDSVSNLPLWQGRTDAPVREALVHQSVDGSLSIRKGEFKLIMCKGSGGWSYPTPSDYTDDMKPYQLYRLDEDAGERRDVSEEYPQKVEELRALLCDYVRSGRSTPGECQKNDGVQYWSTVQWLKDIGEE